MRLKLAGVIDMEEKLPDADADSELYGDQLLVAERVAAAKPVGVIKKIKSLSESLPATISNGLSRRSLGCQRHQRSNAPVKVN